MLLAWGRYQASANPSLSSAHVPPGRSAGRVGPVQGGVDRQQVRQVAAVAVDQVVDPLHADRPVAPGLDGERRIVERPAVGGRAVAPHRGGGHAGRQDLLAELAHSDRVPVDGLARQPGERRHHRGDHQRSGILVDRGGVQAATGDGRPGPPDRLPGHQQARPAHRPGLQQLPPGDHRAPPLQGATSAGGHLTGRPSPRVRRSTSLESRIQGSQPRVRLTTR